MKSTYWFFHIHNSADMYSVCRWLANKIQTWISLLFFSLILKSVNWHRSKGRIQQKKTNVIWMCVKLSACVTLRKGTSNASHRHTNQLDSGVKDEFLLKCSCVRVAAAIYLLMLGSWGISLLSVHSWSERCKVLKSHWPHYAKPVVIKWKLLEYPSVSLIPALL